MNDLKVFWQSQSSTARLGLLAGVVVILALVVGLGYWATARNYAPLFADLSDEDAATMVAELDRMKVPYRLEAEGHRIVVPEESVHKTRLQLVGKNLPLHGAVGFEIFNTTDFGMTEFNQRVNYQRALQGELTRTILSLDEVQTARVHLVMPESTLFKREQNKPKASITLSMKPGQSLAPSQVTGIQRLVAAAVPGIEIGDVTVVDQKGNTISRASEGGSEVSGWQLQAKHDLEQQLERKASAVLDRAFGPGQGLVSVDVTLNFDQVKTTTEEVLSVRANADSAPAGVIVRERQTVKESTSTPKDGSAPVPGTVVTQSDIEYQPGKRIEQTVNSPGSVRRLNVAVVLPKGVSSERAERVRALVSSAVGVDGKRGDIVVVQSVDQLSDGAATTNAGVVVPTAAEANMDESVASASGIEHKAASPASVNAMLIMAVLVGLAGLLALVYAWGLHRRAQHQSGAEGNAMSEAERQEVLQKLQLWLGNEPDPVVGKVTP